jgi:hypothetical protein
MTMGLISRVTFLPYWGFKEDKLNNSFEFTRKPKDLNSPYPPILGIIAFAIIFVFYRVLASFIFSKGYNFKAFFCL